MDIKDTGEISKILDMLLYLERELKKPSIQQLVTFFTIIKHEGEALVDYQKLIQKPKASIAKNINTLSVYGINQEQVKKPGVGLLYKEVDPVTGVTHNIRLTDKGVEIAKKCIAYINA